MCLEILTSSSEEEFREKLLACLEKYGINLGSKCMDLETLKKESEGRPRISIVIDGPSLAFAFKDSHAADALF